MKKLEGNEKLRVHGKLLDDYILESNNNETLLSLKEKYIEWALAKNISQIKNKYIEYNEFFDDNIEAIRKAVGSERKFAAFVGHRLEEFVYLLCFEYCKSKNLVLNKFSSGDIISWIGINSEGKLSVISHGADLAIGKWRKFTIKNGESSGIEEKEFFVPNIVIECKYYVSLDMFRDIVTESEMFKRIYPHSLFLVVCEVIEMTKEFQKMKKVWEAYIDGFFAFRPGKRTEPGKIVVDRVNNFENFIKEFIRKL
ncbi:MAG: Bpu10I family restriction endonuclease [Elusimicrobiota bacterium]|nr:Bpu10I family restriction endonuclease [Elusimicrobiota bacterium]